MGFKNPEEQLDEFLAAGPRWLQKMFQLDSLSAVELSEWYSHFWFWRLSLSWKVQRQFEGLLRQCPERWRKYRKLCKKVALSVLVPSVRPGRPRKDALAQEAIELKRHLSYPRVAKKLNQKYGRGTTTEGAVRQLIRSRKPPSAPE